MSHRWAQDHTAGARALGATAVLVATVLRVWAWWTWAETEGLFPDSVQYIAMAESFPRAYIDGDWLSYLRPPGYPAFLSIFPSLIAAMAVQVGLSIATVVLVWRWAANSVSEWAGTVAAWLIAVEPSSIVHATYVLGETLFTFLLLVAAIGIVRSLQRRSTSLAIGTGVLLGIATLTRPISSYLPLVVGALIWFLLRDRRVGLALAMAALVVTGAWVARNIATEDLAAVSRIEAMNLYYWKAASAIAEHEGRSDSEVRNELEAHMDAQSWSTLGERHRREQSLALEALAEHPFEFVRASWPEVPVMILGVNSVAPQVKSTFGIGMPSASTVALIFLPVYAAAAVGALRLWTSHRALAIVALTFLGYLVALSFGPEAYERFRVPWWPYVAMLASGVTLNPAPSNTIG